MKPVLEIVLRPSVEARNAGLFVSPGHGRHPTRVIDSWELIFVKSGVLGIFEGDVQYALKGGQTILLEAGLRHGGALDYAKGLQFYWMHFMAGSSPGKGETTRLPKLATLRRPERMVELFRRFLDDQEEPGVRAQVRASVLMELILLETLESGGGPEGEGALLSEAEALIAARFHESSFSASKLARALKRNPDYLNRLFKRRRGLTVTGELQRRRVGRVSQMLLEPGGRNMEEIAQESGFSDRTYMRRLFKRLKGMTPREYRKLHGRQHINTR